MEKLLAADMHRITVEEFKQSPKIPVIVVLDNIRSVLNVGSVFRTADAFRIQKIYLCGITSTPTNPEIRKTAIGAELSVDWEYQKDSVDVVSNLKSDGYTIIAAEQAKGSISVDEVNLNNVKKAVLILGNEVKGVDDRLMQMVDICVEIPQYGTKHSLNVSVSGGIVMWEIFKQMRNKIL